MSSRTDRGFQLLGASRADLAASEFRAALTDDPAHGPALAGLALALNALDRTEESLQAARSAVASAPDLPLARAALAQSLIAANKPKDALPEAKAAITMDPTTPWFHGLAALASLQIGMPRDALEAAERGLSLDANDETCANVRGLALIRLNRRDNAESSLRSSLARDPESPYAHAALGHALLTQGKVKEAAEHFRQSLRRDPTNAFARDGLMHTLRSRFIVYRAVLWWLAFCVRMPRSVLVGVIVASFLVPNILAAVAKNAPSAALFIAPIRFSLIAFVVLTWIGVPLFNGLLLLARDGRLLLKRNEKWWGVATLSLLLSLGGWSLLAVIDPTLRTLATLLAACSFMLLLPVGIASSAWDSPSRRWWSLLALAALAGVAAYCVVELTIFPLAMSTLGYIILINVVGLSGARRQ
ncbi:MAG: tetratricopeptide repeat protein [Phycisphaerae bacterium]|nr:tetratricopeptide repeat protein [Phycisphaerae bacterium]